jgi:hypothetical protein
MWEWQHVFQNSVETLLEQVLKILEVQAQINTFILGIPASSEDNNLIYFQPEFCGFSSNQFSTIFSIARDIFENDPEQNIFMTASHLNQAHKDSLYPKALKEAAEFILNEDNVSQEFISFCSFPIKMNNHWIITVIQIDKSDFYKQYQLTQKIYELNDYHKYRIARSFFEAIIWVILSKSEQELQKSSRGENYFLSDNERVLEDAASNLLKSIKVRINNFGGDLLELGNIISSERYEGLGSKGRLVICKKDNPHILVKVNLKKAISINNYRGIRKLLEVSSPTMALLCDSKNVWGLGLPLDSYEPHCEDLFEIKFTEHYAWELVHAGNVMLRVKYRRPRLPKERFNQDQFCDYLYLLFGIDKNQESLNFLIEAISAAVDQCHGTMIVVTPEAESETERLSYQSTCITPILASKEIISHLSSVDGAIVMSPDGFIHSFGVILDGVATQNGNPARGARFNSAIRYVDGQKNNNVNSLAVIVSEDGYVNFYPSLRPRIQRSYVDQLLNDLDKYSRFSQDFDEDQSISTLSRLEKLRFYLLKSDIERANIAKNIIVSFINGKRSEEMSRTGLGYIMYEIQDFIFDPAMTEAYYF